MASIPLIGFRLAAPSSCNQLRETHYHQRSTSPQGCGRGTLGKKLPFHFNKKSRKSRCSRTKMGRKCMPSENFGSPAPKKGEQLLALPQTSGNGSSSVAPVCSATVRSSASLV